MNRAAPRTYIAKILRKSPCDGRRRWPELGRKSRPALLGSRKALYEVRTETTLLPKKTKTKKEKRGDHTIKCLLTELDWSVRHDLWPSHPVNKYI